MMQRISTSTKGITGAQRFQMSIFALYSILVVAMVPNGCTTTDLPADTGASSETNDSGSETDNPTSDSSESSSENSSNPTTSTSGTATTSGTTSGTTTENTTGSTTSNTSESAGTTTETTTESTDEGTSTESTGTATETTTESSDEGSTSTSGTEDSGDTSDSDSGSSSEDGDPLKELGEPCESGSECISGACYQEPGWSACSECENDETCQSEGKGLNCAHHFEASTFEEWMVCSNGALGERCESDNGCQSEICTKQLNGLPLTWGTCGLCHDNEECRTTEKGNNCTSHNWDKPHLNYHKCTEGPLGAMCQEDEDCDKGLVCAPNDNEPAPRHSTCSECDGHRDCRERNGKQSEDICHFRVAFKGEFGDEAIDVHFECVSEGSVAFGDYCSVSKDGDEACNGFCAPLFTSETLGICSPCRPDAPADCPENQTCTPPTVTSSGPVAAMCE